ncbi:MULTISPECIES: hypothetical protein [Bacillaceae]|uniref:DUF2157 domain-containing protein n=1 Tax=Domibacillus aminovorans TaxID=29332 RepID=A0A177KRQ8_9BACI|nr:MULTISPECIES: hypothetical protein [Bacillaceae]OAH56040.1 hypothetical protein AWH48_05045 [Domibacillus aminovorans]OAH62827.1 hypothetical protein AWH49_09185 [Domibacillus aminovorans]
MKKEIIINEILIWKENNMLPPHYCDYLLALYTQGEDFTESGRRAKRQRIHLTSAVLAIMLLPISIFVLYFTEFSFILQTVVLTSFVGFLLLLAIYFSRKKILVPVFFLGAAVMLLLLSLELNTYFFNGNPFTLYGILFLNCLLWLYTGMKLRLIYFTVSALLGFVVILYFVFKG